MASFRLEVSYYQKWASSVAAYSALLGNQRFFNFTLSFKESKNLAGMITRNKCDCVLTRMNKTQMHESTLQMTYKYKGPKIDQNKPLINELWCLITIIKK